MANSDPLQILLQHDDWANRQMLDACAKLTDEQFHRRFEMGPGSVHDTMTHILAASRMWGDYLAGREPRPRLEGVTRSVAELRAYLEEISADLARSAAKPMDLTFEREREGKTYTFTHGATFTHIATHAMHHRAQMLNMLRHLGAAQPKSSVTEWVRDANV